MVALNGEESGADDLTGSIDACRMGGDALIRAQIGPDPIGVEASVGGAGRINRR